SRPPSCAARRGAGRGAARGRPVLSRDCQAPREQASSLTIVPRKDDRLTFGEIVEAGGVRQQASVATRELIARSNAQAEESARVHLYVISCNDCQATKACC